MEKPTTKLRAQDRVILFCVATDIGHGSVGIIDHAMQSMAIRGFIAHNRESGAYTLTDSKSGAGRWRAAQQKSTTNVGVGSKADLTRLLGNVRFTPQSRHARFDGLFRVIARPSLFCRPSITH